MADAGFNESLLYVCLVLCQGWGSVLDARRQTCAYCVQRIWGADLIGGNLLNTMHFCAYLSDTILGRDIQGSGIKEWYCSK